MKLLMSLLLGLYLSLPVYAQESIEKEDVTVKNSETLEISFSEDSEKDTVDAMRTFFYNFGRTRIFTTKSVRFTLRNTQVVPVFIHDFDIRGNAFFFTENCPNVLLFGQRCSVRVFFRPTRIGNFRGLLDIELSGAQDVQIFLRGRGIFRQQPPF